MRIDALLPRQTDGCIQCPDPPRCQCADNQTCFQINRDCYTCPSFTCVNEQPSNASSSTSSTGGVSKGALAGAIVGTLIFLAIAIALFLWYRRSSRFRSAHTSDSEVKTEVPASAAAVLSRPDPIEKSSPSPTTEHNTVRVYSSSSNTTIDLDPESQHSHTEYEPSRGSVRSNPFDDQNSIQTAGSEGTNVIPIALVAPESPPSNSHLEGSTASSGPMRPQRSPDLTLNYNLEHVNVSKDSIHPPPGYANSQVSGISAASSRNSYMSNASYSSDFLNEAPMIITPKRQVIGVGKAEFVNAPSSSGEGLNPSIASRPAIRSPLAAKSFGPSDVASDAASEEDPFSDKHSARATFAPSPSATTMTFGQQSPRQSDLTTSVDWAGMDAPNLPWDRSDDSSRPSSIVTQAGSVIGIENATRVNVGLSGAASAQPRTLYRQTMGRLVTPSSSGSTNDRGTPLQDQQSKAYVLAQARAQEQGLMDPSRRLSGSSVLSATADSILESFPFVPPSPISNRPTRTPPVSPLSQQSFSQAVPPSPLAQKSFSEARSPTIVEQPMTPMVSKLAELDDDLPLPPNRKMLGMSTASQFSTASSGLGSFPFQIDSGNGVDSAPAPSSFNAGRQRASLDTLAITSDLSSYPLGFDRDSNIPAVPKT